jgi:hypothetical protein
MKKVPGKGWLFVKYSLKNGKVVDQVEKECFDKQHAIESFEVDFFNEFIIGK